MSDIELDKLDMAVMLLYWVVGIASVFGYTWYMDGLIGSSVANAVAGIAFGAMVIWTGPRIHLWMRGKTDTLRLWGDLE